MWAIKQNINKKTKEDKNDLSYFRLTFHVRGILAVAADYFKTNLGGRFAIICVENALNCAGVNVRHLTDFKSAFSKSKR